MYDGYTFGNTEHLYNPWSITNYLASETHLPLPYWANSGGLERIDHLMKHGSVQLHRDFQQLLRGESIACTISEELVFPQLQDNADAVRSLLLASGYLRTTKRELITNATDPNAIGKYAVTLVFANREADVALRDMAYQWLVRGENYHTTFLDALCAHDVSGMQDALEGIVSVCVSNFDLGSKPGKRGPNQQPEKYFQGLMTGLIVGLSERFHITSSGESGMGHYDLALEPRNDQDDAAILEFKVFDRKVDRSLGDTVRRSAADRGSRL